ncbi:MAG: adenosylcobinamide-phosphate synthase CbiB [Halorhodospira sp.]
MPSPAVLLGAWLLDRILGEPPRYHPLNGFALAATRLERHLNRPTRTEQARRRAGMLATATLVLPGIALAAVLAATPLGWAAELLLLYLCLGSRSLRDHALAVAAPLARGELTAAREAVGRIVSRDPRAMTPSETARASIESTLENGHDAVLATLFWFLVAGAPGAVAHRLVNTLDALWGYRSERFASFGLTAARVDDLLGWLPARLTALTYALLSLRIRTSWVVARNQARHWPGPNPGVVLAAGAAALGVPLGGPATYSDGQRERPWLGDGPPATAADIERSVALVERSTWLWLTLAVILGLITL